MRVKMSRVMTSRIVLGLGILAALSTEIGGGPKPADANPDSTTPLNSPSGIDARIENLIQSWFAILEDPTAEATTLFDLLAQAPFELLLDGKVIRDQRALLEWSSNFRATYSQIEYRLDSVRIHPEGAGRYRVHFEFDRHALDETGLPHVARREHAWIVQDNAGGTPAIVSIEERPLLFFSGTGPQIICY
jgi:hypothetical protein